MRIMFLFLLVFTIAMTGCRNNQKQDEEESGHAHGAGTIQYTVYTDSCEYFAEISPMVKGEQSSAAVHITRLSNHKPVAEGTLSIRLLQNGNLAGSGDTNKPRIPGIFPVSFTAAKAGPVSVLLIFSGSGINDSVRIEGVTVYENDEQAEKAGIPEEPSGVIKFTKEMAWKIDYKVLEIIPGDFYNIIRVSGELLIPPSEVSTVTAKSDGILVYRKADLVPGALVSTGTILFSLTGQGLTSKNMGTNLSDLRNRFESSKSAYEREKALANDKIVSQRQFEETTSRFRVDSNQYFAYLNSFSGNNMNITASSGGSVIQVMQPNGAFVTEGTPLISIGSSRTMMLRADIPQRYWNQIPSIRSGSFRLSGNEQVYDLDKLNSRIVAKGSALSSENPFVPVTFEFANPGTFVSGTFAEVFLRTGTASNQIVIPVSALLEDQGLYYVYLQTAGESYVKRIVTPGTGDGAYVSVTSGLNPGDRVVTQGAIFIKAASQMSGTPSHGHEH